MTTLAFVAAVRTLIDTRAISPASAAPGDEASVEMDGHRIEVGAAGLRCGRCGAQWLARSWPIAWSELEPWVRAHAPAVGRDEEACRPPRVELPR